MVLLFQTDNTTFNHALALVNYILLYYKFALGKASHGPSNVNFCHALKGLYLSPFLSPHKLFIWRIIFKQGRVTVNIYIIKTKERKQG